MSVEFGGFSGLQENPKRNCTVAVRDFSFTAFSNIAFTALRTLIQTTYSTLTERKGNSRQFIVGVTVQRGTLMCGTDKTLVCCAPVRPTHPSHAFLGRGNVR